MFRRLLSLAIVALSFEISHTFAHPVVPAQSLKSFGSAWEGAARAAAVAATLEIEKQQAAGSLKVGDVRLASLKILQGQQVTSTLELDGLAHKVLLSDQQEWRSPPAALPTGQADDLAEEDAASVWHQGLEESAVLPDFTLAGPLELVLAERGDLALYLPHPADVTRVRYVVLREGATLTVHGARSVALRRALDLPALPDAYLAHVWGRAVGAAAPSAASHSLSGLLHLAHGVQQQAAAWAAGGNNSSAALALVSLDMALARGGGRAWLRAAAPVPGGPAPRLQARRLPGRTDTIELAVRPGQVAGGDGESVATPSAWPLLGVGLGHMQAYEAALKELVALHGLGGEDGERGSVQSMRLTETGVDVLTLLSVEFEVERDAAAAAAAAALNQTAGADAVYRLSAAPLEVWRATVALKPKAQGKGLDFQPLQAELVDAARSSIAVSPLAEAMRLGNATLPDNLQFVYPAVGF